MQEEPENMGAWEFVRPLLEQLIDGRWPLRYIGRVRNSSPSEGSSAWHAVNQRAIVDAGLRGGARRRKRSVLSKQSECEVRGARSGDADTECGRSLSRCIPDVREAAAPSSAASRDERSDRTSWFRSWASRWSKRASRVAEEGGRRVSAGEALVELETEKIDLEVSADRAGVLPAIEHPDGADVKVGEVLARAREPSTGGACRSCSRRRSAAPAAPAAPAPAHSRGAAPPRREVHADGAQRRPRARREARVGAARRGPRVTKQDVLRVRRRRRGSTRCHADGRLPRRRSQRRHRHRSIVRAPGERTEERVRMTKRRATIARRLVEAQRTAAMLTTFNEVDMTAVMALRARRKEAFQKQHGVGLGIAIVLREGGGRRAQGLPRASTPRSRATRSSTSTTTTSAWRSAPKAAWSCPCCATPTGCRSPTVERGIRDFADARRQRHPDPRRPQGRHLHHHQRRRLRVADEHADPQPAAGRHPRPAQDRRPARGAVDGQVVIRPMMYLALSYDHRLVDGREAVQFLVKVKDFIEDPAWLLSRASRTGCCASITTGRLRRAQAGLCSRRGYITVAVRSPRPPRGRRPWNPPQPILLHAWRGGEASALDRLLPLVYEELARIARAALRSSAPTIRCRPAPSCTRPTCA